MAHGIIVRIAQYGLMSVFVNVLVEAAGVPVQAVWAWRGAGALAGR